MSRTILAAGVSFRFDVLLRCRVSCEPFEVRCDGFDALNLLKIGAISLIPYRTGKGLLVYISAKTLESRRTLSFD